MKPFSIYPLAGIDNASGRDDALQVRGKAPHNFLRDAVNVDISDTGRASMRPGLRKVSGAALANLWQSTLHRDTFATLGDQWVKVDVRTWDSQPLATVGDGPVSHLVLNGAVLAAGSAGIFQYDGTAAQRFTLDVPPAPMVSVILGAGSLELGTYGAAVSWLRGSTESPRSPVNLGTITTLGAGLSVILPWCMDDTVTHVRLYLTRQNGGEPLRVEDYPVSTASVELPLLPKLGAPAQFQYKEPMPTGEYLSYWRGRLLTARANVLRFSEALAYHVHDPRHGFVQMPQRITFVHPTDGGVWVGQVDHVAFLAGSALGELVLYRKTAKAPVPGSAIALDAEDAGDVAGGGGAVVAWLAENGYVLGAPDGSVVEKHGRRLGGIAGNQGSSAVFANRLITAII